MSKENIRKLSTELQRIAETELNENPQIILTSLQAIRNWLSKQPHIKSRTDDQFLVAFLRSSKHSIERVKEKLEAYYTIRTAIPEIFSNRDPYSEKIQKILSLGISIYLPKEHSSGARIILNRPFVYNPNEFSLNDILKYAFMASDLAMMNDDNLIVAGQIIVIDLKGLSTNYVSEITPMLLKKFVKATQEAYPYRQKGMHFLNPPKIFDVLFKIAYNFMNEKLKKRVYVHDTLESFHNHISKDYLPKEYGGHMESISIYMDKTQEMFMKNRDWFLEDDQYKTNESKRIGKSKYNGIFGIDGTFKKLDFD